MNGGRCNPTSKDLDYAMILAEMTWVRWSAKGHARIADTEFPLWCLGKGLKSDSDFL